MAHVHVNDSVGVTVRSSWDDSQLAEVVVDIGSHTITLSEYEFDSLMRQGDRKLLDFYQDQAEDRRLVEEAERQAAKAEAVEDLLGLVKVVFPEADVSYTEDEAEIEAVLNEVAEDDGSYVVNLDKEPVAAGGVTDPADLWDDPEYWGDYPPYF